MLIVLSPAKKQNFAELSASLQFSEIPFMAQTAYLVKQLRALNPEQLSDLMSISPTLAELNFQRFQDFNVKKYDASNAKQALFAFQGDVYRGLEASSLTPKQLQYAQDHLRILSGMYGVLKPFDLIQAHRLEMGRRLQMPKAKDLYAYWSERVTAELNRQLAQHKQKHLINLASNEYFKVIDQNALHADVIHIIFKQRKRGQYKTFGMLAKVARGMMVRYMSQKGIVSIKGITGFKSDGYYYAPDQSDNERLIFLKD